MNEFRISGRLTADPDIKMTKDSKVVARFNFAVNRRFKREGEPDADFMNCVAFGKQAEFVEKYLKKGIKIALVGRIQTGNYTNKDGQKVYTTDIVVEEIEFCESKASGDSNQSSDRPSAQQANNDGFMTIPDGAEEELPFN